MSKIQTLVVEAERFPKSREIESCVGEFEDIVGGDFSIVSLGDGFVMICKSEVENETANRNIMGTDIYGDFIIAKVCKNSKEVVGLMEEEIVILSELFSDKNVLEKDLDKFYACT